MLENGNPNTTLEGPEVPWSRPPDSPSLMGSLPIDTPGPKLILYIHEASGEEEEHTRERGNKKNEAETQLPMMHKGLPTSALYSAKLFRRSKFTRQSDVQQTART